MDFYDIHHTTVQHFSVMMRFNEWYNITAVRVLHLWSDEENNRVLLWLLDSNVSLLQLICVLFNLMLYVVLDIVCIYMTNN